MVILPEQHPLAACARFPVSKLSDEPFILLEVGSENEITGVFEVNGIRPNVRFTARDDYAIISWLRAD